jgi:carbon-monoxide dehydrogenase small subunit
MSELSMTVNGRQVSVEVEPRETLLDVLREKLGLTGAHAGCEHGVCGACTVLVDGQSVRSCLMFGVQADGHSVATIEGLAPSDHELHPVQQAFAEHHGLQCGFCTPAMVLAAVELLERDPTPDEEEINQAMSGNVCRCTGYAGIVDAVRAAAQWAQARRSHAASATTGSAEATR